MVEHSRARVAVVVCVALNFIFAAVISSSDCSVCLSTLPPCVWLQDIISVDHELDACDARGGVGPLERLERANHTPQKY